MSVTLVSASRPAAGCHAERRASCSRPYDHRVSELHAPLLRWYDEHARDLPWRRTTATPWGVLVSELMLQQTPVARVLPVYDGLAGALADPGLAGRRTRRVTRSAPGVGSATRAGRSGSTPPPTAITEQHDGDVPDAYDALRGAARRRRLHGLGRAGLRVRAPAARARHQRPPGAGPRS